MTLVKDTQKLVPARSFSSVRLVVVGDEKLAGGEEIVGVASERLGALGLAVEVHSLYATSCTAARSCPRTGSRW